ncbi:SGNH/GDSL hydrolase family protein [Methylocystis sp. Sn-Cys]|uniref:SGNH/GDSL hydrolase family protein n=1 Tax=Methylocystis sp. Sn-Cys TaxID=1701263 RepID=UPI001923F620|nr:SGNH/GDSL hydrolase family protein [Methylocystis sp. Sn-Cys]MBL1256272.1 SGNH/GDSL hydrolase family protein [Methylocystis sp. Sn-Cys]
MSHLVLLGDSIFDNGAYTAGAPAVISQVRKRIPIGWRATLAAVDGATMADVAAQLARLPADADRLILSIGGNDVLQQADILGAPVTTSAEAIELIGAAARRFEAAYRDMLRPCLQIDRHTTICTVYSGNFTEPAFQRIAEIALTPFNDAIIRIGVEHGLTILDLRLICSAPTDYAGSIEPSSIGGGKIAEAIVSAAKNDRSWPRSARIIG